MMKMSALQDKIQVKEDWCEFYQEGSWQQLESLDNSTMSTMGLLSGIGWRRKKRLTGPSHFHVHFLISTTSAIYMFLFVNTSFVVLSGF